MGKVHFFKWNEKSLKKQVIDYRLAMTFIQNSLMVNVQKNHLEVP